MRIIIVMAAVLMAACASDAEPTCWQGIVHYYNAGCAYFSGDGSLVAQVEMGAFCQAIKGAPERCLELEADWTACNMSAPAIATGPADCPCSDELVALVHCE